jgi:radical SAM superfamily enzyme YgiQ (UPF0313 family)
VLEYLAGLTRQVRPDIELELVDAHKEGFDPEAAQADLVGISVITNQAPWAYRTAERLRRRDIKVILGGMHITSLPDEARGRADAIVTGECEQIWRGILDDAEKGRLKPEYQGGLPPLDGLPRPVTDLWNNKYLFGYFQTARGCPYRCTFCSVHKFFGDRVRLRPIPEVVDELASGTRRLYWCIDDNVWGVNVKRSIELYREMSLNVKGKWWFGSGDFRSIQHPRGSELLKYARKAGLTAIMLGWESNNPETLDIYRAASKQGRDRRDAIKKIKDSGIDVMLFVIMGGRNDTREDFDGILSLCDELKVSAHPVMMTPLPATELYESYRQYLMEGLGWDAYDGNHAVFEHPTMSAREREEAFVKLRSELFTIGRILKRIARVSLKGFPMSHISSWMLQYPQGKAFKTYADEWRRLNG